MLPEPGPRPGHPGLSGQGPADRSARVAASQADASRVDLPQGDPRLADLRPAALDRVIRISAWIFLLAATTIVAATNLWPDRQPLILALLAAAALYSLVLNRAITRRFPDRAFLVVEGVLGLGFATLLVALTGGAGSPFFFVFPLIVAGAAIVVSPGATLVLTVVAGSAFVLAVAVGSSGTLSTAELATTGVNVVALGLLAFVGMAAGGEHRRAREVALQRATVDPLTGLRTRAYLYGALEREISRSQRTGRRFCLLMLDLDNLKRINDRFGHLIGDRALRVVGDVILAGIRRIDTGSRFGGDEFVVLLPETDPTGGWILAEKVRQGVAEAGLAAAGLPVETSVSVGVVTYPDDGESIGELLEWADRAMYGSKRSGRDRVTGATPMGPRNAPREGRGDPV